MTYYYYVSGQMVMTSSGSFTRDRTRGILFDQFEVERILRENLSPYGATKQGAFIEQDNF